MQVFNPRWRMFLIKFPNEPLKFFLGDAVMATKWLAQQFQSFEVDNEPDRVAIVNINKLPKVYNVNTSKLEFKELQFDKWFEFFMQFNNGDAKDRLSIYHAFNELYSTEYNCWTTKFYEELLKEIK